MHSIGCSIIVPTVGRPQTLKPLLESLDAQAESVLEIIVVCDGPDDATRRLADSFQSRTRLEWIWKDTNTGQAAARNRGAEAARGKVLLFLDDDMLPPAGLIEAHLRHHTPESELNGVVVYGEIIEAYDREPATSIERYLRIRRDNILAVARESIRDGNLSARFYASCGANCSVTRKSFVDAGGFDEDLGRSLEDSDLGLRLMDRSVRFVVENDAKVRHINHKNPVMAFRDGNVAVAEAHLTLLRKGRVANPHLRRLASLRRATTRRAVAEIVRTRAPVLYTFAENAAETAANKTGSLRFAKRWCDLVGYRIYVATLSKDARIPEKTAELVQRGPLVSLIHSVSRPTSPFAQRLCLSPARFRKLCSDIARIRSRSETLGRTLKEDGADRRVTLTFDDAYDDFFTTALPILSEFGLKATLYVVSSLVGKTNEWDEDVGRETRKLMSADELREACNHGIEIGSHSVTHAWLPSLNDDSLREELTASRKQLEDLLGVEVTSFAYPSGAVNVRVRNATVDAGYKSAVTTVPGSNIVLDAFAIERVELSDRVTGNLYRAVQSHA